MKDDIISLVIIILPFYMIINALMLLSGLIDAQSFYTRDDYSDKITRIELIFPGHKIGCWLGSPL